MEIKSQTNTFEGGMDMDTDVSYMSNNTYRYAENVRLVTDTNGTNGILQNIQYIKEYLDIEQLKDQIILHAIAAQIPDDNDELQNSAIILTQDKTDRSHNHIYIVSNFNTQNITCKCILKIRWQMNSNDDISMIYNYETSSVYKLYINSYRLGLNILNLHDFKEEWGDKPVEDNMTKYSTRVTTSLPPLLFEDLVDGALKSGTYQYYYKLYTDTGVITTISSGSQLIYNGKRGAAYKDSGGYTEEYTTSNGIKLGVTINNRQFQYFQIFRVYWKNNNDLPDISLFSEGKISQGDSVRLEVIDTNNIEITKISAEEFNDIIPFLFNSRTAYQFGNRLFFSNITSNSWDIPEDFDCRAYRCNSNKEVQLETSTGKLYFDSGVNLSQILNGTVIVDKEADAINPMNNKLIYPDKNSTEEYAYDLSGNYGGEGINIQYNIVYALTQEGTYDSEHQSGKAHGDYAVGAPGLSGHDIISNTINVYYLGSSQIAGQIELSSQQTISFFNPIISTKLTSYQRDEVYRFGIVFYNSSSIATPVHWIGDVRFPSGDTVGCEAFTEDNSKRIDLIARPLGIKFTIKRFPEGAVAAEIVRCDRTSADRSIRAQGMVSTAIQFKNIDWGANEFYPPHSLGDNDVRAPFIPVIHSARITDGNYNTENKNWDSGTSDSSTTFQDTKLFASPEVCVNPSADNIQPGDVLIPIYVARSIISPPSLYLPDQEDYITTYAIGEVLEGDVSYRDYYPVTTSKESIYTRPNADVVATLLLKYYNFTSASSYFNTFRKYTKNQQSNNFISTIDQYKTARTDIPFQGFTNTDDALTKYKGAYVDTIMGRSYTNIAVSHNTVGVAGINGLIGLIIDANNILSNGYNDLGSGYPYPTPDDYDYAVNTIICNVKRQLNPYGGNSYYNRAANLYISCGSYIDNISRQCITYGGDTFLTNFCYQHVGMIATNDWDSSSPQMTTSVFAQIPIESTINTYMRSDNVPLRDVSYNEYAYYHTQVGTINAISQTTAMYQYNSAYSVSSGGVNYAVGSTNSNISNTENNRYQIVCTEAKSAGEVIDSWTISKFANTLDLDSKYGQVTKLIDFGDKLYALQQNALSVLSINERSLISDNSSSALVLGSGGILDRYDVIVSNYGTNVINDRSAVSTFQSIYWYDNNKNVICSYGNDGFHILSKEKKVQTFLNNIAQVSQVDAISMVNDKQNEVWMKFKGKLLAYNEHSNQFTSFYTHNPDWGLRFYDRLVTIQNKRFYYTNTFGEEDVVKKLTSKITFVVNQDPQYTKVFDNQWFAGNIEDPNNDKPQVLSNINFNTKTQDSFTIHYNDVECREDTYRFPIPRQDRGDIGTGDEENQNVINRSYQPRMRGKYLLCNYELNCDEDRQFEIPFIKTTYRQSML